HDHESPDVYTLSLHDALPISERIKWRRSRGEREDAADLRIPFEAVFDLGFVVQTPGQTLGHVDQNTDVETVGDVVTLNVGLAVRLAGQCVVEGGHRDSACELPVNPADHQACTDGNLIIDLVADGGLQVHHFYFTGDAMGATGMLAFIVAGHSERDIQTQAEVQLVVDWSDVIGKGHGGKRHHVA